MRAVFCSTHLWRAPVRVGTHHFGAHLVSQGWEVDWFSVPVTPVHLAAVRRTEVRAKWRAWVRPETLEGVKARGTFSFAPMGGPAGYGAARWWPALSIPSVRAGLRARARPDLAVIDTPLFWFAGRELKAARSLYRVTDYTPGFPGMSQTLLDLEREAVASCDATMVTVPSLGIYARELGATRVHVVPNGANVERLRAGGPEPSVLSGLPHPRAVYVGSLRAWFDVDLVGELARRLPEVTFVIAGPPEAVAASLPSLENLHFVGAIEPRSVPAFLANADVGIIPFDVANHRELIESVDPLKLYEYLAAGLPVVASRWRALEDVGSPALLASNVDEFTAHVQHALANGAALRTEAEAFAATVDWGARFDALLRDLGLPSAREARR